MTIEPKKPPRLTWPDIVGLVLTTMLVVILTDLIWFSRSWNGPTGATMIVFYGFIFWLWVVLPIWLVLRMIIARRSPQP